MKQELVQHLLAEQRIRRSASPENPLFMKLMFHELLKLLFLHEARISSAFTC
jgi:hypothetical protein